VDHIIYSSQVIYHRNDFNDILEKIFQFCTNCSILLYPIFLILFLAERRHQELILQNLRKLFDLEYFFQNFEYDFKWEFWMGLPYLRLGKFDEINEVISFLISICPNRQKSVFYFHCFFKIFTPSLSLQLFHIFLSSQLEIDFLLQILLFHFKEISFHRIF
jgi:hypothetical protein